MPRFVILEHDGPSGRHWDFMLEAGPALATWALADPPEPGLSIAAEALVDHRLAYLEYEGPVSGDRGAVTRWDSGTYDPERQDETHVVVRLAGRRLVGLAGLTRSSEEVGRWTFVFEAE